MRSLFFFIIVKNIGKYYRSLLSLLSLLLLMLLEGFSFRLKLGFSFRLNFSQKLNGVSPLVSRLVTATTTDTSSHLNRMRALETPINESIIKFEGNLLFCSNI